MITKTKLSLLPKILIGTILLITALLTTTGIKRIYDERIRFIESDFITINEFDFIEHWDRLAGALQWNEEMIQRAKIEDLRINYKPSNEIENFTYAVVWEEAQGKRRASVHLNNKSEKFEIQVRKIGEWPQYDRLILAGRAFSLLSEINISDLYRDFTKDYSPPQKLEFYGLALGERESVAFAGGDIFVLEGSKIEPFIGKLPVEASWLQAYDHVRMNESSGGPTQGKYFLFDVKQN